MDGALYFAGQRVTLDPKKVNLKGGDLIEGLVLSTIVLHTNSMPLDRRYPTQKFPQSQHSAQNQTILQLSAGPACKGSFGGGG